MLPFLTKWMCSHLLIYLECMYGRAQNLHLPWVIQKSIRPRPFSDVISLFLGSRDVSFEFVLAERVMGIFTEKCIRKWLSQKVFSGCNTDNLFGEPLVYFFFEARQKFRDLFSQLVREDLILLFHKYLF